MKELYKLRSFGYAEIDDDIWFPNLFFNALIKLKKSTGRIEIIDKFPNYRVDQGWLYSTVYHVNGYLVFVPNNSEEIVAYHINTKKFISTALNSKYIGNKKTYFVNAYVYKHYVYMFPMGAMCIVRYDVKNHSVKYLNNCLSTLLRKMPETFYCFYQQFEVIDDKIYFPFLELNAVAVFHVIDEQMEIKYLDIDGGCSTINYIDGFFYLASWNLLEIYRWNIDTGEIKTYQGLSGEIEGGHLFLCACNIRDTLIFLPEQWNTVIAFSVKTGEICKVENIYNLDKEPIKTYFANKEKEGYCVLTSDMKYINYLFYDKNKLNIKPCCQMDSLHNKKQIDYFWEKQIYYVGCLEREESLKEYIEVLINTERTMQIKEDVTFGEQIFRQLLKT